MKLMWSNRDWQNERRPTFQHTSHNFLQFSVSGALKKLPGLVAKWCFFTHQIRVDTLFCQWPRFLQLPRTILVAEDLGAHWTDFTLVRPMRNTQIRCVSKRSSIRRSDTPLESIEKWSDTQSIRRFRFATQICAPAGFDTPLVFPKSCNQLGPRRDVWGRQKTLCFIGWAAHGARHAWVLESSRQDL